jgi:hypothetical protein
MKTSRSANRSARSGFALVEIMVAGTVLLIGILAVSSATWRVHKLRHETAEQRVAENRLRSVAEEIRSIAAIARQDPDTWAATVVGAFDPGGFPGGDFETSGLDPLEGADFTGSIEVVIDETETDADLGVQLGLPRDLDGDGLANNPDVSGTATILPIIIRIQWTGKVGTRSLVHGINVVAF